MAFADHLTQQRRTGGIPNLITDALNRMPDGEADAARALLASDLSDGQVAQAFTDEGYPVKWGSVRNWRLSNRIGRFQ